MKIVYAGLRAEQYNEKRKPSFEYSNFYLTLANMPGVDVFEYPFDSIIEKGKRGWNEELFMRIKKESPDVLFAFMYTDEFEPETLMRIQRETKTRTIAWFADDYWRFWNYSRIWAPRFDLAVTTSRRAAEWYASAGIPNVMRSQWAANPAVFRPVAVSGQDIEMSFIGQHKPSRAKFINALRREGIRVETFGAGWQNGRVPREKLLEIVSRSKISLSMSNRPSRLDPWVLGRLAFTKSRNRIIPDLHPVRNFEAWWHYPTPHIHARPFELSACGGFVLAEYAEGFETYYEDGKEMVFFGGSAQECAEKASRYLKNDAERKRIADAGRTRTVEEHTYEKRFAEIFETVSGLQR